MATRVRIKLNRSGIAALLKSAEVEADLSRRAENIRDALPKDDGAEYEATSWTGQDRTGGRAMAMVKTSNYEARRQNAEDNTLIRALDAGRG